MTHYFGLPILYIFSYHQRSVISKALVFLFPILFFQPGSSSNPASLNIYFEYKFNKQEENIHSFLLCQCEVSFPMFCPYCGFLAYICFSLGQ